jgi:hypothetical protein
MDIIEVIIVTMVSLFVMYVIFTIHDAIFKVEPDEKTPEPTLPLRSDAAQKVLYEYGSLDAGYAVEARDIDTVVDALEVKYTTKAVDNHLSVQPYSGFYCDCAGLTGKSRYNNCEKYPEYIELWRAACSMQRAIERRKEALAEAAHRDAIAGVQFDLDRVSQITASLAEEAQVMGAVNLEISKYKTN